MRSFCIAVVAVVVAVVPARAEGLAGPWRVAGNFGLPELIGIGVGRTFGDDGFRIQVDAGTIVLVSSVQVHLQRLVVRYRAAALAVGLDAGAYLDPDLISDQPEPRKSWLGGGRAILEIGGARGLGFVIEAGAMAWTDPSIRSKDAGTWSPSFALRLTYAWER